MKLSLTALALTIGLLWGGAMLIVGIVNVANPSYGVEFIRVISSVYPGFLGAGTAADVLLGAAYGLVDGALAGLLIASIYNFLLKRVGGEG